MRVRGERAALGQERRPRRDGRGGGLGPPVRQQPADHRDRDPEQPERGGNLVQEDRRQDQREDGNHDLEERRQHDPGPCDGPEIERRCNEERRGRDTEHQEDGGRPGQDQSMPTAGEDPGEHQAYKPTRQRRLADEGARGAVLTLFRGPDVEPPDAERHQGRDDDRPAVERGRASPRDDREGGSEPGEEQTSHELGRPGPVTSLSEDDHRQERRHRGISQQREQGGVHRACEIGAREHRELHHGDEADSDPCRPLAEQLKHDAAVAPVRRPGRRT